MHVNHNYTTANVQIINNNLIKLSSNKTIILIYLILIINLRLYIHSTTYFVFLTSFHDTTHLNLCTLTHNLIYTEKWTERYRDLPEVQVSF